MAPVLSVVIPWSNRAELGTTIQRNREAFQSFDLEVIVVNCGGDSQVLSGLVRDATPSSLRVVEVLSERFNKCLALNIGAFVSRAPRLLFLDADVVVSSAVVAGMVDRTDENCFVTMRWVIDSNATSRPTNLSESIQTMELVWVDGQRISFEFFRSRACDQARGGPGLICLMREHFLAVQGMNSRLTSWGWEDLDLIIRLQATVGVQRVLFGEAEHLHHDDSCRNLSGATRQESVQRNMSFCYANYERGKFSGTLKRDLAANKHKVVEHSLSPEADASVFSAASDL